MAEQRMAVRKRTLKAAKIAFNDKGSVLDCTMRNLSETGACLSLSNVLGPPAKFDLLHDGRCIPCEVVWRQAGRIGVRFLNVASVADVQTGATCACPKCRVDMRLIHSVPACDDLPEVQAFRCQLCGETIVREND